MTFEFIANNWYLFVALVVVLAALIMDPIRQHASGVKKVSPLELPQVMRDGGVIVDSSEICISSETLKGPGPKSNNGIIS